MAFHDIRLPEDIERGAQGGPRFKTSIVTLSSGFEHRNLEWAQTRGEWDIGYGLQHKTQFSAVADFFYARRGRGHSFRFKDWTDFELARQVIGATDGATATFQVFKRYTSGSFMFDRDLHKIVPGTVSVWVDGVPIVEGTGSSQYQIDLGTGVLTLGATLAAQTGTDVEIQCEFDVAVRFDTDALDLVADTDYAASIPNIPIVEIRVDATGAG